MAHTLKDTIDLAVKTAILRAHPIGSYYLTEGNEGPKDFIGGAAVQYHAAVQGLLRLGAHGLEPVQEVRANG